MNKLPVKSKNITKVIPYLESIGNGRVNYHVIHLLSSFDDLSIKRLNELNNLMVSIHHIRDSIMVDYWDSFNPESIWTVEVQNCHISDDVCELYYVGLALFLSHIRPDAIIFNNFYYGLCYDEETDDMYYNEEKYLEELSGESVLDVDRSIIMGEA